MSYDLFKCDLPPNKQLSNLNKPGTSSKKKDPNELIKRMAYISYVNRMFRPQPPKRVPPAEPEQYFYFHSFEYFCISKKTIKEMCEDLTTGDGKSTQGVDVHIYFKEDLTAVTVPRVGFSCLSLQDLYHDRVRLQGSKTKPSRLGFVKLLDYMKGVDEPMPWAKRHPKRGETLTISLDVADLSGVRIRFTFSDSPPSPWFRVRYPPFMPDYSLVIDLPRKHLFIGSIDENVVNPIVDIQTTFGWLNSKVAEIKHQAETGTSTSQEGQKLVRRADEDTKLLERECIICSEPGSDTLLYPCRHLNLHQRCYDRSIKRCYICNEPVEKTVKFRKTREECFFCGKGSGCRTFDSCSYPCGCSHGCLEGFRKNTRQLGINCIKCGAIIETMLKIFV